MEKDDSCVRWVGGRVRSDPSSSTVVASRPKERTMRQTSARISLLLALSCAGQRPAAESSASSAATRAAAAANQVARAELTPPTLRLPDMAAPTRYALELTVLAGEPGFESTVEIALNVRPRASVLLRAA